ncbi:hypothetical protein ACGFOU_25330 [Streptomyces sp. NPDC048595]|uniref:DUF7683 domain-containing protein n=1 Tax=Streptomyces sp. NPDC048595 TaxID=3365576 RepID=UPI00371174AD
MRIVGTVFRKDADFLDSELDVSEFGLAAAAGPAGVPPEGFLDAYPLDESRAAALTRLTGIAFDLDTYEYFLEPEADQHRRIPGNLTRHQGAGTGSDAASGTVAAPTCVVPHRPSGRIPVRGTGFRPTCRGKLPVHLFGTFNRSSSREHGSSVAVRRLNEEQFA